MMERNVSFVKNVDGIVNWTTLAFTCAFAGESPDRTTQYERDLSVLSLGLVASRKALP